MTHPQFHRTLVRVIAVQKDGVWLCVPGWDSSVSVLLPLKGKFSPGQSFFAEVNLGVESPRDLQFRIFELDESVTK